MQQKFTADEKVLCYHGPLLYEAKILKSKKESGIYSYFVHYQVKIKCLDSIIVLFQGWNKNWDEWVQEGRIMKQVPESYEKQKKLLMVTTIFCKLRLHLLFPRTMRLQTRPRRRL